MSQPGDEDCDSVLSDSSTSGSSGSSAASGALSGDSSAVCPICDYNSRNVRALWQHINAVHISLERRFRTLTSSPVTLDVFAVFVALHMTKCGIFVAGQLVQAVLGVVVRWRIPI